MTITLYIELLASESIKQMLSHHTVPRKRIHVAFASLFVICIRWDVTEAWSPPPPADSHSVLIGCARWNVLTSFGQTRSEILPCRRVGLELIS
jgi:hypothetical protein